MRCSIALLVLVQRADEIELRPALGHDLADAGVRQVGLVEDDPAGRYAFATKAELLPAEPLPYCESATGSKVTNRA